MEQPFEVAVKQGVISGAIDLLLRYDDHGRLVSAEVLDFKTMEGGATPEENEELEWTELSLQVQLYALAAHEVLGENARTGAVHLLRDGQRVAVPVDFAAIRAAVENVEWAIDRILAGDFPMRPTPSKCESCDFKLICTQQSQTFGVDTQPPPVHVPAPRTTLMVLAFRD